MEMSPGGHAVENCADPTVVRSQTPGDDGWYLYCTQDALHDDDRDGSGNLLSHLIPMFRSADLVHWIYQGDAFASVPPYAEPGALLWAPEIQYFGGRYLLYYAVTSTKPGVGGEWLCGSDSAIGVATAAGPLGPWTHAASPVVAPRRSGTGCSFHSTIDPEVVLDPSSGKRHIFYGGFGGGIEVRELSTSGLTSNASTATLVAVASKFEAPEVLSRDGHFDLFLSSTDCCRGPLTGYLVLAGRSPAVAGPYVDREGNPLTAGRAGGTPVLAMNGNGFVGPGHNTVVTDYDGQDWTLYHAIDESDPYFAGSVGYSRRALFMDALDWPDGWPRARGGWWCSTCPQEAPAAQPGSRTGYEPVARPDDSPSSAIPESTDEFAGTSLDPRWSWVRPPAGGWLVGNGEFRFDTQAADLWEDDNSASVLKLPAPPGDFLVETRVNLDVPPSGCCYDYVQAGLVLYSDDDNYLRLTHVSNGSSRQTEFGKEIHPVPAGYPRYGSSAVGPPSDWTWLRLVRRLAGGDDRITAYTSQDGAAWVRGATWRHRLGPALAIGLVAMGRSGYVARFDFVRTSTVNGDPGHPDEGPPAEVVGLSVAGGSVSTIAWSPTDRADAYDVTRGRLSSLSGESYGACLANDLAATSITDADLPASDDGFLYLVRGENPGCGGAGSLGAGAGGNERSNLDPEACP